MSRDYGRKRRYSDVLEDPYKGPQEFLEAGARGFLITSVRDREEHAIDEAVKVLRKTCVKLYGGIKPIKREDASFAKGYVMIDFMDHEQVTDIPHPDAEKVAAEEAAKKEAEEAAKEAKMDSEQKQEGETAAAEGTATEETPAGETKPEEKNEDGTEKTQEQKDKEEEIRKKREERRKKKEEEEKKRPPLMLSTQKFKGYRTELRNMMFVKSDIADPVEVLTTAFDLMADRKPLITDCINQLLPVQGVCDNDYKQLEIMCRRVLEPYVGEHLEEPPSFGVLFVDKMCDPGAEVLLEVVKSAIWSLNPLAWQSSPWTEPDVVIHLEIIGSKIILAAMPHYMKYRQYSPFALFEMGHGKPEDEENLLKDPPKQQERKKKRGKDNKDDEKKEETEESKEKAEGEEAGKEVEEKAENGEAEEAAPTKD